MTHPENTPASATPTAGHDDRARRARREQMTVRPLRDGGYVVETDGGTYVVDVDDGSCTCPDHAIRGARCKHLRRVAIGITEGRTPAPDHRTAVCAACGGQTFVPVGSPGPQLCERHRRDPGDLVRDRETGSLLVVTAVTAERADGYRVEALDSTVADVRTNAAYGAHEPVVEAVYLPAAPPDTDALDRRERYAFPATRLVVVGRGYVTPGRDRTPAGAGATA